MKRHLFGLALSGIATLGFPGFASAQQVTGVLGSPAATTTLSGKQLPPPDPKFGGVIKQKASESQAWWAPRVVPPKGAPNVLLIMTDDAGFGAPGTFGGVIPTPALDRIAKSGLRYTNFHSTSLCSPTRAALITGRNHHVAGFGVVGEATTGFPGYDSVIRKENGTIGTILKENGYATSWFGKNHNTPFYQATPVPQHDGDLPLRGQSELEPDDGHGRRGDPVHEGDQGGRAREAVPGLLRAGRHARPASSDARVDQED